MNIQGVNSAAELFRQYAVENKLQVAVISGRENITYGRLLEESSKVSSFLINKGIQKNEPVIIYLNRSVDFIVAVIGVLLSGGCYCPADIKYPVERISDIVSDTKSKYIITGSINNELLEQFKDRVFQIKTITGNNSATDIFPAYGPDDLCYVIFTSGTTGKPKGVMIENHSLLNLLSAFNKIASFKKKLVTTSVCPFTFDVSVWEIFSSLCYGGTLHILDTNKILDVKYFSDYISKNEISSLYIPPGLLEPLISEFERSKENYVIERLLVGVEPIKQKILQRFKDLIPEIKIINGYGPTETTICSTFYKFEKAIEPEGITPIGKAVDNYEILITDENFNIVPDGEQGEILVGGAGVSRGYIGRKELTNEKFIDKKILGSVNDRFYKTGDFAKKLADGNIQFSGRKDNQVKYRGYRIELEEIESVFNKMSGIKESAALIFENSEGNRVLICFYSSVNEPDDKEIIRFLGKYLPEYMIPVHFIRKNALPRTDAGKIDKKKLSSAKLNFKEVIKDIPDDIEDKILLIIKDSLALEKISPDDNFFELGGYSIVAIKIIGRIYDITGIEIDFGFFFNHPVIQDIIEEVKRRIRLKNVKDNYLKQTGKKRERNVFPVSPAQSRIYFIEEFSKGSGLFNIPFVFEINGNLNTGFLEKSINVLIKRNRILRTYFFKKQGELFQRVVPDYYFKPGFYDVSGLSEEEKRKTLTEIFNIEDKFIFNFGSLPLFSMKILKFNDNRFYLIINIHHIISDNWSVGLFFSQLSEVYNSLVNNDEVNESEFEYQYEDFTLYQYNFLNSDKMEKELSYWKRKLESADRILNLPGDYPRPKYQTYNGNEFYFSIGKELMLSVEEFCRKKNISVFMFMFSCFAILLSKYSGQKKFILGTPIANRTVREFENVMGMMINNLAVPVDLSENPDTSEIFSRIKNSLLEAYDNQNIPFEKIIDVLKIERLQSHSLLIQVMFNFLEEHRGKLNLQGLDIFSPDFPRKKSHMDLTFSAFHTENSINCCLEYNTDIYSSVRIKNMEEHLITVISEILNEKEIYYSEISFITNEEKLFILNDYNGTDFDAGKLTAYQLFEKTADSYPSKTALISGNNEYTYSELKKISESVSGNILQLTKGRNIPIGIYMNRSEDLIFSILGIWKSGCCYIPLDPEYPSSRISFILNEAKPEIIISDKINISRLNNIQSDIKLISDLKNNGTGNEFIPEMNQKNISYIIYTSGSTGKPKGVEITDESLVNFLKTVSSNLNISTADRLLSVTTFSFDISILEFFLPLVNGAVLIIAGSEESRDGFQLERKMKYHKVTLFQATPATYRILLETVWNGNSDLKLLCGGEAFPKNLAKNLINKCDSLYNMYGPTETTIWSTFKKVELRDLQENSPQYISIGKPLGNTYVYVTDEYGNILPAGIPGELCIGGLGVSIGYHNDPNLTNEKFIHNKFKVTEAKMFRTGDVVYFDYDYNLHFLERNDGQVKIRGFRIDLSEIELALNSLEQISEKVVKIVRGKTDDKVIAVYYVKKSMAEIKPPEIKDFLRRKLPEYMIPSYVINLDSFPLTPNGKIDKKNLPEPDEVLIVNENVFQEKPSGETELMLTEIWKNVLNISSVSVNDDFFESGGNSILAVKVIGLIERKTGFRIPLTVLFEERTIRSLARIINNRSEISWKSLVPIKPDGSKKPVYIIHGAGLHTLLYNALSEKLDYNQPVFGLQAKGLNGIDEPLETVEEIAKYYVSEILDYDKSGSYCLAGYSFGGTIAFEMAKQFTDKGFKINFLGLFDTVAYSPDIKLSKKVKFFKTLNLIFHQVIFAFSHFLKIPAGKKKEFIKRKYLGMMRRLGQKQYYEFERNVDMGIDPADAGNIPDYLKKLMDTNYRALDNYILKPSDVKVNLFRAEERTFYISDIKTYGWAEYALKGVETSDIPGDHNSIFSPPNDSAFADIFQNELNKANEEKTE